MKNLYLLLLTLFVGGAFFACDTEDQLIDQILKDNPEIVVPPPTGDPGTANFSKFVAIGDNFSSGFMDAALYNSGQAHSYPKLLSQSLSYAGAGDFNQADIGSDVGYNALVSDPAMGIILGHFILDTSIPGPAPVGAGEIPTPFTGDKSALSNFSVSGIQVGQLLTPLTGGPNDPGNPAYNPLYARFATNPGTSTILGDALMAQPTFISLWIGTGDVLGYALSGASNEAIYTDEPTFEFLYNTVVDQILANSVADATLMTIPPITTMPFFRAVTYNPVPLDEGTANALNAAFGGLNAALDGLVQFGLITADDGARRKVAYSAIATNPLLVFDQDLNDLSDEFDQLEGAGAISPAERAALQPYVQSRPATADDLVLLTASTEIGKDLNPGAPGTALLGITVPMFDEFILTPEEQGSILARTLAFNTIIATASAKSTRLSVTDVNPLYLDWAGVTDGQPGIEVGGQILQPDFSPNGVYSTDGINLNPRGNALVGNEVIKVLENQFGASIPAIEVLPLRGVLFQ